MIEVSAEFDKRQRAQRYLTFAALSITAVAAWVFLVKTEIAMQVMQGDGFFMELMWMMMRPDAASAYLAATATMWVVMMIAMMVPAVMPMLIVFQKLNRGKNSALDPFNFAVGYLVAWAGFSLIAAVLQWAMHAGDLLGGTLLSMRPLAAGAILVAAGCYQLTPMKDACLEKCRSPMGFFLANSRPGRFGAFVMGVHHGLFCVGCCWVLMLIMFVGGAMSVLTMALLTMFILAERILPAGPFVARAPGFALIAAGLVLAING